MQDCKDLAGQFSSVARSAKFKAVDFIGNWYDFDRFVSLFYGTLSNFQEMDVLQAAGSRLSLSEQVVLAKRFEGLVSASLSTGDTYYTYFLPRFSTGVLTVTDVPVGNLRFRIDDADGDFVSYTTQLNEDVNNFHGWVVTIEGGFDGLAVRIKLVNNSSYTGDFFLHHISANDFPALTNTAIREGLSDFMTDNMDATRLGKIMTKNILSAFTARSFAEWFKGVIIDAAFDIAREGCGGCDLRMEEAYIRAIFKNVR